MVVCFLASFISDFAGGGGARLKITIKEHHCQFALNAEG
jgi:hypothetical protein